MDCFLRIISHICPHCGEDNGKNPEAKGLLLTDWFSTSPAPKPAEPKKPEFDIYDWDNPDNCSDREYMYDDYDDFDG